MFQRVPEDLIDRRGYPIVPEGTAASRQLVAQCRAQLADDGACVLPGFLRPAALAAIVAEIEPLFDWAYYCAHDHNPYLAAPEPALSPDHPRNQRQISDLGCLADDQIPAVSLLRAVYDWPALRRFLARVLDKSRLFPYADPLGSLNVNIARPGQQLGWHFDNADFAITLLLQASEAGGVYEYVPQVRTDRDEEGYDRVGQILGGAREGVRTLAMPAGALVLFQGRRSLHRVTPTEGPIPRLIAVLSYDTEPGVMLTEHNRRLFYGRVA